MRPRNIIETLVHITIWISGFILVIMFVRTLGPFKRVDNTLLAPVAAGTLINIILFYTVSLYMIPLYSRFKRSFIFIGAVIIFFMALSLLETFLDNRFFVYYYSDAEEPFSAQYLVNILFNFLILSTALGYGFVKIWIKNEQVRASLRQEKLEAELNFLKTQLNPHFLFNVLNIAFSSASCNGDDKTAGIILKISGLMRYMIYESNSERVPLSREIEYLENYISLQEMRFSEDMKVDVRFNLSGDYSETVIAPLVLITFIENAFKYGVKLGSRSVIDISINVQDEKIIFRSQNPVFNTGDTVKTGSSGIGLKNTEARLALLYPSRHKLDIVNDGAIYTVNLELAI